MGTTTNNRKEELILAPQGVVAAAQSHDRHLNPRLISTGLKTHTCRSCTRLDLGHTSIRLTVLGTTQSAFLILNLISRLVFLNIEKRVTLDEAIS